MHDISPKSQNDTLSGVEVWKDFAQARRLKCAEFDRCIVIRGDSRKVLREIPDGSISCGITSPPYGELKDYGSARQIGFGQDIATEYLPDLHLIFRELLRITKAGGALWVVLDMLRHAGETVVLPWEVISIAKAEGWTFHDLVVWDKGKSLPWPNPGRFRGVCEYILLLGKGRLKKFDLDGVRDSEHLSPYWIKYPERYHPEGKAPSDLWHFPIPNQGTWSGTKLNHACPFPVGLVERMISITSSPGDTILDPFAGTASVPMIAGHLGRIGVGVEVNSVIVDRLRKEKFGTLRKLIEAELPAKEHRQNKLRGFIVPLRMQKYAKTLYAGLVRPDQLGVTVDASIGAFVIESVKVNKPNAADRVESGSLGRMTLTVLLKKGADLAKVRININDRQKRQPLSLFGLSVTVNVVAHTIWSTADFVESKRKGRWFCYRKGKFYAYEREFNHRELFANILSEVNLHTSGVPTIFSQFKLDLQSPPKDSVSL